MKALLAALGALAVSVAPPAGAGPGQATKELRLPALFSSGVVLQRETQLPLWGFARPGRGVEVTPSWDGETRRGTADERGRFEVLLDTPTAGGPFRVRVSDGQESLVLEDVLVGRCGSVRASRTWSGPWGPAWGRGSRDGRSRGCL